MSGAAGHRARHHCGDLRAIRQHGSRRPACVGRMRHHPLGGSRPSPCVHLISSPVSPLSPLAICAMDWSIPALLPLGVSRCRRRLTLSVELPPAGGPPHFGCARIRQMGQGIVDVADGASGAGGCWAQRWPRETRKSTASGWRRKNGGARAGTRAKWRGSCRACGWVWCVCVLPTPAPRAAELEHAIGSG